MSRQSQKRPSLGVHQQNSLHSKNDHLSTHTPDDVSAASDSAESTLKSLGSPKNTHDAFRVMRRRRLVRFWLAMISLVMVSILFMSYWAVKMSREKAYRGLGACFRVPRKAGDRRRDKNHLSIVNFNAEWLFLRGGTGQIVCPSESCPWAVHL